MTKAKEVEDVRLAHLERIAADHEKRISTIENGKKGRELIFKGIMATISRLIQEGFFGEKRTIAEVQGALAARGYSKPTSSLSGPLQEFVRNRSLERERRKTNGRAQWVYWSRSKAQRRSMICT